MFIDDAPVNLSRIHLRLRRGDFDDTLLQNVREYTAAWQTLTDERLRLKGIYVSSEVFDYFGDYKAAAENVSSLGVEQLALLGNADVAEAELMKRRIWVALAYATVLYRREDYSHTLAVLDQCSGAVDRFDPMVEPLFGTRAKLHYCYGQVCRQLRNYPAAESHFCEAIEYARQRFVKKTPEAELVDTSRRRTATVDDLQRIENERLHAQCTTGRALALGLGWIAYTIGSLATARMLVSAGYTLLRGTQDTIHRAYALLLLGVVERARAGDDSARLNHAITLLEDAARGLREHPIFRLRALYELALANYVAPKSRQVAEAYLREMRQGLPLVEGTNSGNLSAPLLEERRLVAHVRNANWNSAALVVESRIRRLQNETSEAKRLAVAALTSAQEASGGSERKAEALIAWGEALVNEASNAKDNAATEPVRRQSLNLAISKFREALESASGNPKIEASARLHLAAAYCESGDLVLAHSEFSQWSTSLAAQVEHGSLQQRGREVERRIKQHDWFCFNGHTENLCKRDRVQQLEKYLVEQAKLRERTIERQADLLDVDVSTFRRMERRVSRPRASGRQA